MDDEQPATIGSSEPEPAGDGSEPATVGGLDLANPSAGPDEPSEAGTAPALSTPRRTILATAGRARAAIVAGAGGLVVLVVIAVVVLGAFGSGGRAGPSPSPSASPTFAFGARSVGIAAAPVTIEIWADFQCPFCGLFSHAVEPSLVREEAVTGRAIVTFRDFAFLGQESLDAAVAARCAGSQEQFWRYHDLLFASQRGENQGAFSRDVLLSLARFAGLDSTAFAACLADPAIAAAVRSETQQGRTLGVGSTPTLRIVGPGGSELISGIADAGAIEAAVNRRATMAPSGSPGASPSAGASPSVTAVAP
jgi:protein-disulfide isomerase